MSTLREALEASLVENPDDLAAHSAYADYLMEQGDPRGEFIQVQLALEDPGLPGPERNRLKERESELSRTHESTWLGKLAPHAGQYFWSYSFARGWLDELSFGYLPIALARDLAKEPAIRLLRRLRIGDPIPVGNYFRFGLEAAGTDDEDFQDAIEALVPSPYLNNLRAFHLGSTQGFVENQSEAYLYNSRHDLYIAGGDTWDLIDRMPRLEELYLFTDTSGLGHLFDSRNLTNLRILQVYLSHFYPLGTLSVSPALARLTHLSLHPQAMVEGEDMEESLLPLQGVGLLLASPTLVSLTHLRLHQSDLGDEGCEAVVHSGILRRLKFLDLARGRITDAGARILAACPDLRHLDVLDVSCNALTVAGIEALKSTGITVRASDQHGPHEDFYLYEGEME
jgi:uncharacterized protein (TIGR02996 family)